MDSGSTSSVLRTLALGKVLPQLLGVISNASLFVLVLSSLLLISRRWNGGLSQPLSTAVLALTAVVLFILALSASKAYHSNIWSAPLEFSRTVCGAVVSVSAVAITLSLSLQTTPIAGLTLLWLATLGVIVLVWAPFLEPRELRSALTEEVEPEGKDIQAAIIASPFVRRPELTKPADQSDLVHSVERRRLASGEEYACGLIQFEFQPQQRQAVAHVAFCPAFAEVPKLQFTQISGPLVQLKETQVVPYGLRLEARLNQVSTGSITAVVEFYATDGELAEEFEEEELDELQ